MRDLWIGVLIVMAGAGLVGMGVHCQHVSRVRGCVVEKTEVPAHEETTISCTMDSEGEIDCEPQTTEVPDTFYAAVRDDAGKLTKLPVSRNAYEALRVGDWMYPDPDSYFGYRFVHDEDMKVEGVQ
jgi:hypothetical protein